MTYKALKNLFLVLTLIIIGLFFSNPNKAWADYVCIGDGYIHQSICTWNVNQRTGEWEKDYTSNNTSTGCWQMTEGGSNDCRSQSGNPPHSCGGCYEFGSSLPNDGYTRTCLGTTSPGNPAYDDSKPGSSSDYYSTRNYQTGCITQNDNYWVSTTTVQGCSCTQCTYDANWSDTSGNSGGCGGNPPGSLNCNNNQMLQKKNGHPSACADQYRCQPDGAGSWDYGNTCGEGSCGPTDIKRTRNVTNGCEFAASGCVTGTVGGWTDKTCGGNNNYPCSSDRMLQIKYTQYSCVDDTQCVQDNSCENYKISGQVYIDDTGGNGINTGDPLVNGVTVHRGDAGDTAVKTNDAHTDTTSGTGNNKGAYSFTGLVHGTYPVGIENPNDSCYNIATTNPSSVTVNHTNQNETQNFRLTRKTFNITGHVYLDDGNGNFSSGDTALRTATVTVVGTTRNDTADNNGLYTITGNVPDNYSVRISGFPNTDYKVLKNSVDTTNSTNTQAITVGCGNYTINWLVKPPAYTISGYTFIDENGSGGNFNAGDTKLNGVSVHRGDAGDTAVKTDSAHTDITSGTSPNAGVYSFPNLPSGTYPIGIDNPNPSCLIIQTAPNPNNVTINTTNGDQTQNFRLARKTFTVTGTVYVDKNLNGLFDDSTVLQGARTTVMSGATALGHGDSLANGTYSVGSIDCGSYTAALSNLGKYTFNKSRVNGGSSSTDSSPAVTVSGANQTVDWLVEPPTYTIKGNVFLDNSNGNGKQDNAEPNITDPISVSAHDIDGNALTVKTGAAADGNGTYTVSNITTYDNTVTVSYAIQSPPYYLIYPQPATYQITVGTADGASCAVVHTPTNDVTCGVDGNVTKVNFAVTNAQPWFQTLGGDIRYSSARFSDSIPTSVTTNPYASVKNGTDRAPGIVYYNTASTPAFGPGGNASANGWVVSGQAYSPSRYIRTSYSSYLARAKQAGPGKLKTGDASALCEGGTSLTNCNLKAGLTGYYNVSGDLTLGNASTLGDADAITGKLVLLVSGNVTISENLTTASPNMLIISASGDLIVTPDVGTATASDATTQIEGLFSADGNFTLAHRTDGATDLRLNIGGAAIAHANPNGSGTFANNRNLLGGNVSYPSFTVVERPDFIINYPPDLSEPSFTWTEVSPLAQAIVTPTPTPTPTPNPTPTPSLAPTPTPTPNLPTPPVVLYEFDQSSGTTAPDTSGHNNTANLINNPTWVSGKLNKAVNLDGTNQYLTMPNVLSSANNFTVTAWVFLRSSSGAYSRIFDFGNNTTTFMSLTPKNSSSNISFSISIGGTGSMQQIISSTSFPTGVWTHLAVTLNNGVGRLYVNCQIVGTNNITLHPSDLGNTTNNYIGKSQFADPYLNATIDNFRVYNQALDQTDLQALCNDGN